MKLDHNRFANIFKITNYSDTDIWNAVKQIRSKITFTTDCSNDGLLYFAGKQYIVSEVETKLKIKSSDVVFEDMTDSMIEKAAKMYLYLVTCSDPIKPWFLFYSNLFLTQTPDEIILTLNRIMKGRKTPQNEYFKMIASKLLDRTKSLISQYDSFEKRESKYDKGR